MGPDPEVQVFPKLLQFRQDLFGGAEILQILREFGQQVKVPSNPDPKERGPVRKLLGGRGGNLCISGLLSPLSLSTSPGMSPGQCCPSLGGLSPLLNVKGPHSSGKSFVFPGVVKAGA